MSSAKTSLALLAFALAASTAACASSGKADPNAAALKAMEEALKPASAEERAAANRADPLTRANFWGKENAKDPEDLETALEFARSLREIGSHDRAIDVLSRTMIVHPKSADLLMLMGRIQMSRGDINSAGMAFQRAVDVAPDRAETWAALGTAYDRLERHNLAQTAYRKALDIEPQRTTTLTNFGLSLLLTGDLQGAEEKLRLAAANPDAGPRVTENLALVLGLQGRFDEMKRISAAAAPAQVVEQNAALLKGLIRPARSWDALAEPARLTDATPSIDPPAAAPGARIEDNADGAPEKRTLRLRN
ncbi:MAG: tetratricopeptide repeat protein [Hyphomonas sp.]